MTPDDLTASPQGKEQLQDTGYSKPQSRPAPPSLTISTDGMISCGSKKFPSNGAGIRGEILRIIGRSLNGYLPRDTYQDDLIDRFVKFSPPSSAPVRTGPYFRRKNNVNKAISRLRQDLERFFSRDLPTGTRWMCFSEKIDGWLLYRLPGLGCDGEYHW